MLELPIRVVSVSRPELQKYRASFREPIICYLYHQRDVFRSLPSFVIVDFQIGSLTYILTYSADAAEKVEQLEREHPFMMGKTLDAHSVVKGLDDNFLVFLDDTKHFYQVDAEKKMMRVMLGDELPGARGRRITGIGSTFYKDTTDPRYFYYTLSFEEHQAAGVEWHRAAIDLSSDTLIYTLPTHINERPPHTTRQHGDLIFNSEFLRESFFLTQSGRHVQTQRELMTCVLQKIYADFCVEMQMPCTEQGFAAAVRLARGKDVFHELAFPHYASDFELYVEARFGDATFKTMAESDPATAFTLAPGRISLIDIPQRQFRQYETTFAAPAHFEFSPDGTSVYVSSHNFAIFMFKKGRRPRTFFGPAALDRFDIVDGRLEYRGTFTDPTGYRFTTHRVFERRGKTYIATFGEPRRLFLIDGETMQVVFCQDIDGDVWGDVVGDKTAFVEKEYATWQQSNYIAFEVSHDSAYLGIIGVDHLAMWSLEDQSLVEKIPWHTLADACPDLDGFYVKCVHCEYFN